jgi:hypothetical protein
MSTAPASQPFPFPATDSECTQTGIPSDVTLYQAISAEDNHPIPEPNNSLVPTRFPTLAPKAGQCFSLLPLETPRKPRKYFHDF